MTITAPERRKYARSYIELEYRFFIDGNEYAGKTSNISLSGAFLNAPNPDLALACVSQPGRLELQLNNERMLSFKCEVVYIAGQNDQGLPIGAGVAFCDTDDDTGRSLLELAAFVEECR